MIRHPDGGQKPCKSGYSFVRTCWSIRALLECHALLGSPILTEGSTKTVLAITNFEWDLSKARSL